MIIVDIHQYSQESSPILKNHFKSLDIYIIKLERSFQIFS